MSKAWRSHKVNCYNISFSYKDLWKKSVHLWSLRIINFFQVLTDTAKKTGIDEWNFIHFLIVNYILSVKAQIRLSLHKILNKHKVQLATSVHKLQLINWLWSVIVCISWCHKLQPINWLWSVTVCISWWTPDSHCQSGLWWHGNVYCKHFLAFHLDEMLPI